MNIPLSERLRPKTFTEVFGQEHLVSKEGLLSKIILHKTPLSLLLWGPPGCGKTTIARLYAKAFNASFSMISATSGQSSEIKTILSEAKSSPLFSDQSILFIDEIHRLNKAQQDLFLPALEDGSITLIAATTENPSFALNNALLSRLRVLEVKPLDKKNLKGIIHRFLQKNSNISLTEQGVSLLCDSAKGDARVLLNNLENIAIFFSGEVNEQQIIQVLQEKPPSMDKSSDIHYNLISVLHKAIRASDVDAALYWLSRMLKGEEDRNFICRRLTRIASEDIGLADPNALTYVINAWDAFTRLGSPEGELSIAQAVCYLSMAPKSNAVYKAFNEAWNDAEHNSENSPPLHALNAPTKLMKDLMYGKDYQYDHDLPSGFSGQNYFPSDMNRRSYYFPVNRGFEREMIKRKEYFESFRAKQKDSKEPFS